MDLTCRPVLPVGGRPRNQGDSQWSLPVGLCSQSGHVLVTKETVSGSYL